jgi:Ca2+-binding RTX toxin-like protein
MLKLVNLFLHRERRQRPSRRVPLVELSRLELLDRRILPAVTATFSALDGQLTVNGDAEDNTITISRDAAGTILVNNGQVSIVGGAPTVDNTAEFTVLGFAGNDTISLDETNGALPAAAIFGSSGNDTITGGSGADQLFGEAGNDTLLGKDGADLLFGGAGDDTLTGGRGDDQVFGQAGNDRMIWNPGDGSALNEGGAGSDTVEVNGGNVGENFTVTANGARVRFDRVNPAPFFLDIGTTENLVVNANGGDDTFSATGNLAALVQITVDGGAGNDTINGGNGDDLLLGGDGNDFIDGNQGTDVARMGTGDDVFQWDPGDGNDTVEGQDGTDTMLFNGNNISEVFEASANGERVLFTRNVGNIVMDLNDVERIDLNALGGTDTTTVNDLSGTDLVELNINLAAVGGAGDGQVDTVIVNGTNSNDTIRVAEDSFAGDARTTVLGLAAQVSITNAEAANDRLTVNARNGDDTVDASGLSADAILLTEDGGNGDDALTGGAGDDTLLGENGDDVLIGGPGQDVLDGGRGHNHLVQD